MPYYCTVPRCTSMAGKAKNVSFHQFPRDKELAKLWNDVLKRGKPYTKYSKVCSLHFRPDDYTMTSVGKNKGQWRTLRKDAVPSMNLPTEEPTAFAYRQRTPQQATALGNPVDQQICEQLAQAIYMQTMLAMHSSLVNRNITDEEDKPDEQESPSEPDDLSRVDSNAEDQASESSYGIDSNYESNKDDFSLTNENTNSIAFNNFLSKSLKCDICSKCFKDPDIFLLHKRSHEKGLVKKSDLTSNEVRSLSGDTLKSNPILAGLLKIGYDVNK